jgi:hypothetical protein
MSNTIVNFSIYSNMYSSTRRVISLLCVLPFADLVRSDLPPYSGPYGVGTIDLEVPIALKAVGPYIVNSTGQPAFKVGSRLAEGLLLTNVISPKLYSSLYIIQQTK